MELVYKIKVKPSEQPKIECVQGCYKMLKELCNTNRIEMQKEFKAMLLNGGNKVIGVYEASDGGITGTTAEPRLRLAAAIKSLAVSIVFPIIIHQEI